MSLQGPGMALYLLQETWNWPEGWKGNGEVEGQPVGGKAVVDMLASAGFSGGSVTGALLSFSYFFSTLFFAAAPALTWQA